MSKRSRGKIMSTNLNLYKLRCVARRVLPLYRKIAADRAYAKKLSRAIRTNGDVEAIIRQVIPIQGIETAKVGFFMCYGKPGKELCTGTILRSENAKFTSSRLCAVARAIIPFYEKLIKDPEYALRVLRAVRSEKRCKTKQLVKQAICTSTFRSVTANRDELRLYFHFKNRIKYENCFFS